MAEADDGKWVNRQGWLHKLGFDRPNWKKRWFVLERNVVSYYSSDSDWKKKKPSKGSFVLDFLSFSKIKAIDTDTVLLNSNAFAQRNQKVVLKRPNLIQIGDCRWNESGLRTFFVSADTEEERKAWLNALLTNCEVHMSSSEGLAEESAAPVDPDRKIAYAAYMEEKKRADIQRREEQVAADKALRSKQMKEEPWYFVHNLCSKGSVEELKLSIQTQGVDVRLLNPNGGSTLLQAATYGNVPIMEFLIDQKLDINSQSHGGNTPLHAAACMGFVDAVRLLLERGANRSLLNKEGKSAAQAAKTQEIRDLIDTWGQ